ncbi:MAG: hypothetical protein LBQ77_04210 [Treponema sp.]|jgi:hypothetical protein|nr:hypothetical protein [Treponema sp.]
MKNKSLYLGIALVVAMNVVFVACKDDENPKMDEETFTDVSAHYGIASGGNTPTGVTATARQSNKDGTIYISLIRNGSG